ncbi:hypothetical protein STCU_01247 [Strigomonas culicis]|uniref:Uncharacterized protein n=1 Tax=Strigomonas culicis TaxID=28005 RepID=S9W7D4_9TRYP|nr:hypothetical protein STCU_01247 [Strigomonas culicis]|eukprot:EPY35106.1 hypothetical protein STCU_01247 [Strigomonas culicis]
MNSVTPQVDAAAPVPRENTSATRTANGARVADRATSAEREAFEPDAPDVQVMAEVCVQEADKDDEFAALRNVKYHMDRPFEDLPPLVSPEMKIIGRCVRFSGETMLRGEVTTMFYEGLVNTITKNNVTLMHVFRYTEEDFNAKKAYEEKEKAKPSAAATEPADGAVRQDAAGAEAGGSDPTRLQVRTSADPMNQARRHAKKRVEPMPQDTIFLSGTTAGNTPAATTASSREDLEERVAGREPTYESEACESPSMPTFLLPYGSEALHSDAYATMDDSARNKLRGHDGTIGPLPYITFQRFHIHDVQFGNDPRSQFYSLFSCPERKFFDMQCLRMFVRRYIVHTSQNNNPRQVSLRRFIVSRCNCPSVEDALLVSIAQEELLHLVKADREMRKKTEPQPSRAVREYRAPAGLFWNTGILYITRIPVHTFLVGGLECAMVCALIVYSVVTFQTCDYYVIYELLRTYLSLIIALGIVGLIAGIFYVSYNVIVIC